MGGGGGRLRGRHFPGEGAAYSVRRGAAPYFWAVGRRGGGCARFKMGTSSQKLVSLHNICTIGKNEGALKNDRVLSMER